MKTWILVVVSVAAFAVFAPAGPAAQTSVATQTTRDSGTRSAPTTNGRPNLEGVWTYGTATPFERPAAFANKPSISDLEAEEFHRQIESDRRGIVAKLLLPMLNWGEQDRPFLRVDGRELTSIVHNPADGRVPALTVEARRRFERLRLDRADSAQDRSLMERCVRGVQWPPLSPDGGNPYIHIFQTTDVIGLVEEEIGARLVPLGDGGRTSRPIPRWLGESRGRWEGDTLVVETSRFRDQSAQGRVRNRFDGNLHLIERFTLVGPAELRYEFVVEDPTVFVSSWGGALTMRRTDSRIHEWGCHEGNYSLPYILSGARAQERAGVP